MNIQTTRLPFWFALGVFLLTFGFLIVPRFYPALGQSFVMALLSFLLSLLLLVLLPIFLLLSVWSIGIVIVSKLRKRRIGDASRIIGQITLAAVLSFAAFVVASIWLPRTLPTGSHLAEFDRSVWLDPTSSKYVEDDITPRQKMVADVVARLPGRNRQEIEEMLGPSEEEGFFLLPGWDLIYLTGPQRDSVFAIDSEWLLIWLDDTGTFERYEIYSD
jgi:hypothetical protein